MSVEVDLEVRDDVPLAPCTTLGLGGPARHFVECRSEAAVRAALEWAARRRLPVFVLGGGSNVVFPDAGFPGLVLHVALDGIAYREGPAPEVAAGAGVAWDAVVREAVSRRWGGIECLSGIPGTAGATPIQNVGAYGQEVAHTLRSVACLDRKTLERRVFSPDECGFDYRSSRFKTRDRDRYVILEVIFTLQRDAPPCLDYAAVREAAAGALERAAPDEALSIARAAVLAVRRGKSMVLDPNDPNTRSAGSFFMNPVLTTRDFADLQARWHAAGNADPIPALPATAGRVKVPAAWLVERAGFAKGYRRGGVGISSRHALALVNHGGTTAQLVALAGDIVGAVRERFGIRLEPEPDIVRPPVISSA